jgi:hypothetical protein
MVPERPPVPVPVAVTVTVCPGAVVVCVCVTVFVMVAVAPAPTVWVVVNCVVEVETTELVTVVVLPGGIATYATPAPIKSPMISRPIPNPPDIPALFVLIRVVSPYSDI